MVDQSLQLMNQTDWAKAGIAKGSDTEKAMLVDVAYSAKAYQALKADPDFQKKSPEEKVKAIQAMVDGVVDDSDNKNPFVTDTPTKTVIKNYAHELIQRSEAIDDKDMTGGKKQDHGTHLEHFLDKAHDVLNSAATDLKLQPILDDANIEKTVQDAHAKNLGSMYLLDKDHDAMKQLDYVRDQLSTPEKVDLGVKRDSFHEDMTDFVQQQPKKAFAGVSPDAKLPDASVSTDNAGQEPDGIMGMIMKLLGSLLGIDLSNFGGAAQTTDQQQQSNPVATTPQPAAAQQPAASVDVSQHPDVVALKNDPNFTFPSSDASHVPTASPTVPNMLSAKGGVGIP